MAKKSLYGLLLSYTLQRNLSFFILLEFLQTLTNFYNIWPTVHWVNLQHNR